MQEITIRIPNEIVDYLQRLDYELNGLKVLHTHALNAGVPLEKRLEIRREFAERFEEFRLAKQEMWEEFGKGCPHADWRLDYASGILHIKEEGHA